MLGAIEVVASVPLTVVYRDTCSIKYTCFFLVWFSREYYIKNMFNTLHHKIIYDERDIWMYKMLILAIVFFKGNLMTFLL